MNKIVSIQGSMASGKSSVCRYLEEELDNYFIVYEDISKSVKQVKRRNLDKNIEKDYYEIQKIFIKNEIRKYENLIKNHNQIIYDLGPEDIEFYTLNYPKAIKKTWDAETNLHKELEILRKCRPQFTIFLEVPISVLKKRKASDESRNRSFFDFYIEKLHPLKVAWYKDRDNTVFLNTIGESISDIGDCIMNILESKF